jgi:hypothetical protein
MVLNETKPLDRTSQEISAQCAHCHADRNQPQHNTGARFGQQALCERKARIRGPGQSRPTKGPCFHGCFRVFCSFHPVIPESKSLNPAKYLEFSRILVRRPWGSGTMIGRIIWDNYTMICKWLSVALAVGAFGGCAGPTPATPAGNHRPQGTVKSAALTPGPSPASGRGEIAAAAKRTSDDFGLPLVIVMDVPDTPPEIKGPSPPIREEPRHR